MRHVEDGEATSISRHCLPQSPRHALGGARGCERRVERASLAPFRHFPDDAVVLPAFPTAMGRYTEPRPGRLSTAQTDAVVATVAAGRTLRDVAAAFGISPERVRQLARPRGASALAAD